MWFMYRSCDDAVISLLDDNEDWLQYIAESHPQNIIFNAFLSAQEI